MKLIKKATLVLVTLFFLLNLFLFNVSADTERLNVVYFYSSKCMACRENKSFIESISVLEGVNFISYNKDEDSCQDIQMAFAEEYELDENLSLSVPRIYFGKHTYELTEENQSEVKTQIMKYLSGEQEIYNFQYDSSTCPTSTLDKFLSKLTIPSILIAGFLDGVNPCAISLLLVFFSFLLLSEKRNKILIPAFSFILGIFLANISFGLGIRFFYDLLAGNDVVTIVLYSLAILLCIVAIVINTIDIINDLRKTGKHAKNQLPNQFKYKLISILRASALSKWSMLISFAAGFIIGITELACTGQIYFPTIVYMIEKYDYSFESVLLLVIYNLMFILPLIIVTTIAYFVKQPEKIKEIIMKHNWQIKLVANIFFIIMSFILLNSII